MVETMTIDLKVLLLEQRDCDAGTVRKVREALTQGGNQYRALREAYQVLEEKVEKEGGSSSMNWRLRAGIAAYYLGRSEEAIEHLSHTTTALAHFLRGKALASRKEHDAALKAFEKAESQGYVASQVHLQKAGILRQQGNLGEALDILENLDELSSHDAEYHFQLASCFVEEGERPLAIEHLERAVELDPGHTGALFQLGHANDLAGNDHDAIDYYERALSYPPIHVGTLKNLGILYEDNERYEKAVDCFQRAHKADPKDEEARLFLKDARASLNMYINPEEEVANSRFSQVLEIPVTDFELSVRSRNCLKKMNIRTLGDLTRVSEQQLLSSKNFGETSLTEIKEILGSKGLKLGQSLEEGAQNEMRFRPQQPLSEEEQAVLNKSTMDLNLSVRARKCMSRLGINSVGELIQRSADELLESKNFGQTSLSEVREKLSALGLSLRGD